MKRSGMTSQLTSDAEMSLDRDASVKGRKWDFISNISEDSLNLILYLK
jgi:hypothetical protein